MDKKENYFNSEYKEDKRELRKIDAIVSSSLPLFYSFYTKNGWPYEIENGKTINKIKDNRFSASTSSMILYFLSISLGYFSRCSLFPKVSLCNKQSSNAEYQENLSEAFETIFKRVINYSLDEYKGKPYIFRSDLFGKNDPFTLTWFLEIVFQIIDSGKVDYNKIDPGRRFYRKIIKSARKTLKHSFENCTKVLNWEDSGGEDRGLDKVSLDHAFPILRSIHLYFVLKGRDRRLVDHEIADLLNSNVRSFFYDRIHQHLSFFSIEDSAFDPAEIS